MYNTWVDNILCKPFSLSIPFGTFPEITQIHTRYLTKKKRIFRQKYIKLQPKEIETRPKKSARYEIFETKSLLHVRNTILVHLIDKLIYLIILEQK